MATLRLAAADFRLNFMNGTTRQIDLFMTAVNACVYPWERLVADIRVVFRPDPDPDRDFEAATATYEPEAEVDLTLPGPWATNYSLHGWTWNIRTGTELERAVQSGNWPLNRPLCALIEIQEDLDNPEKEIYVSDEFFMEVCIHELAHCVSFAFTQDQVADMCAVLGIHEDQWEGAESSRGQWMDAGQEAYAEIFKDLFLPKQYREFSNRTNIPLVQSRMPDFYRVLEATTSYQVFSDAYGFGGAFGASNFPGGSSELDDHMYFECQFAAPPPDISWPGIIPADRVLGEVYAISFIRYRNKITDEPLDSWSSYFSLLEAAGYTDVPQILFTVGQNVALVDLNSSHEPDYDWTTLPVVADPTSGNVIWRIWFSGNYIPAPPTVFTDTEITERWVQTAAGMGAGILARVATDVPKRRPGWPYAESGIGAGSGPPGTVRRSRP